MEPQFVTAHLQTGDYPAVVTRANPDGTLNLAIFSDGGVVHRMGVSRYEPDPDDVDEDKIGYWTE
jgi:hypothetical protein